LSVVVVLVAGVLLSLDEVVLAVDKERWMWLCRRADVVVDH
jgi:hypothetical protein